MASAIHRLPRSVLRLREPAAVLLMLAGAVLASLSVTAVWLNSTLMDQDRWIETVAPLAESKDTQAWLAESVTGALIGAVDLDGYVDSALGWLPGTAAEEFVAPFIGATEETFRTAVEQAVASDAFPAIWEQMNRTAHSALLTAVTARRDGLVGVDGGTIALETDAIVDAVIESLADKGFGFVRLVKIPEARRRIVLMESDAVANLVEPIVLLNRLAWVLPLASVALLAAAFGVTTRKRRLLAWAGAALALAALLPLETVLFGRIPFAGAAYALREAPDIGAQAIAAILFRGHVETERTVSLIGVLIWAGAVLAQRALLTPRTRPCP